MSDNEKEQGQLDQILRYWKLLRPYRQWILLGTLGLSFAAFNVIALMQDYYQGTTTILVDPQQIPDRYVTSTVVEDPNHRLSTISQQVLSASRLQPIIDQFNLYPGMRGKSSQEQIIQAMVNDIDIKVKEGGSSLGSFTITYKGTDPNVVAQVANRLAAGFIEWNLKNREQVVEGTTDFLTAELDKARQNLQEQESKLSQFKIAHAGEMPDDQPHNMQMLGQLQASWQANREAINRLDVQRTMILHAAETGTSAPGTSAAPLSPRAQLLAEKRDLERKLAELRKTYTPEFPDIVAQSRRLDEINASLRQLPPDKPEEVAQSKDNLQLSLIDKEIARLNEEQKQIKAQMGGYNAKMAAAPIRQQQMVDLARNYQVSSNDYASLLQKTSNSQLAAELEKRQKGERFTILDAATVPGRPFKPNRRTLMMGAVFAAFCFSVMVFVVKDMISGTVRNEDDLLKLLPGEAPVLAVIPAIDTPTVLRRRRLQNLAVIAIVVVACGVEALIFLSIRPIL